MKKSIIAALMFLCVGLVHGVFIASTTMTNIGATESWYILTTISGYQGKSISFDLNYTKGDETNIYLTIAYAYSSIAPAATDLSFYPESNSAGVITALTRYISATGRYTLPLEVPNRAFYVILTFEHTAGTPTGTVVVNGRVNY